MRRLHEESFTLLQHSNEATRKLNEGVANDNRNSFGWGVPGRKYGVANANSFGGRPRSYVLWTTGATTSVWSKVVVLLVLMTPPVRALNFVSQNFALPPITDALSIYSPTTPRRTYIVEKFYPRHPLLFTLLVPFVAHYPTGAQHSLTGDSPATHTRPTGDSPLGRTLKFYSHSTVMEGGE